MINENETFGLFDQIHLKNFGLNDLKNWVDVIATLPTC